MNRPVAMSGSLFLQGWSGLGRLQITPAPLWEPERTPKMFVIQGCTDVAVTPPSHTARRSGENKYRQPCIPNDDCTRRGRERERERETKMRERDDWFEREKEPS